MKKLSKINFESKMQDITGYADSIDYIPFNN